MRALILCLLLAPAFVHAQTDAAQAALDAIAACNDAVGDQVGSDVVVEDVCPDLDQALNDSGYSAFVSFAQRQELTADSLSDLHEGALAAALVLRPVLHADD